MVAKAMWKCRWFVDSFQSLIFQCRMQNRSSWRKTSKNMSKWRKLFEWITQQLTDSDTVSHHWQVDGRTHLWTFNRIRKLLPGVQGSYKVDPGRCSVVTTYGILVKKLKEEREMQQKKRMPQPQHRLMDEGHCIHYNFNLVISAPSLHVKFKYFIV